MRRDLQGTKPDCPSPSKFSSNFGLAGAVLIGLLAIAATILVTFRWELRVGDANSVPAYRLDRWTGEVVGCNVSREAARVLGYDRRAITLDCQP